MRPTCLGEENAQFFSGPTSEYRQRGAGSSVATGEHLAGIRIGGQPPLIDAVAVVLGHQYGGLVIHQDQEISGRIEVDRALGEPFIQGGGRREQRNRNIHGAMLSARSWWNLAPGWAASSSRIVPGT